GLVGLPAAWLLPLAAGVHALRLLRRLGAGPDRSGMIFLLGVAVLLPVGIGLAMGGDPHWAPVAGLWGSFVAFYVQRFFGSAGAWFVLVLLLSALMAWTLSWNPIRAIVGPSPAKAAIGPATLAERLEPPPAEMPAMPGAESA